jgi:hypothetical protein
MTHFSLNKLLESVAPVGNLQTMFSNAHLAEQAKQLIAILESVIVAGVVMAL